MPANARIQKARALLKDASRAFDADEIREGCRLMWEASLSGMVAVAERRGLPHKTRDDLFQLIYKLDHEGENPPMEVNPLTAYYGKFVMAEMYLEHAVTEDDEWDYDGEFRVDDESLKVSQRSIKRFIDHLEVEVVKGEVSE